MLKKISLPFMRVFLFLFANFIAIGAFLFHIAIHVLLYVVSLGKDKGFLQQMGERDPEEGFGETLKGSLKELGVMNREIARWKWEDARA